MQCKRDKELTIDLCILIWLLRLLALLWSGCWRRGFSHVSALYVQHMRHTNICIHLSVCVSVREMCIGLNIVLHLVSTVKMVKCAEEPCTRLDVADTAMSTGCLISPVNPVSWHWSCQGEEESYLKYNNRLTADFLSHDGASETTLSNYSNFIS